MVMDCSPRPHHVFVVEDDPSMRDMLADYLYKQGLRVTALGSAEEMLAQLNQQRPDLVVLDVNLPGASGLQTCQRLRSRGDMLPVILLTARVEEIDRVLGLEMGADDYLGKPFSARELLARIRAVLRRTHVPAAAPSSATDAITLGSVRYEWAHRRLVGLDGAVRPLSTLEHALLSELLAHPNQPLSREHLLQVTHGSSAEVLMRTVDVAVMRLRKLVEPDPAMPRYVQTVRGHGYMFVPTVPAVS